MIAPSLHYKQKALELGLSEETIACAITLLSQNKNLVNAIDHKVEMDDYIYRAIIRQSSERRRQQAEKELNHPDPFIRLKAQKELSVLSKEELLTDPFYRAVLPLLNKVFAIEPILKLYADEASAMVLELADFKRRHRATSLTEVIVKRCSTEIEAAYNNGIS